MIPHLKEHLVLLQEQTTSMQCLLLILANIQQATYVAGISGTTNQITVTGSGSEGATPVISLPAEVTVSTSISNWNSKCDNFKHRYISN